MVPRPAVAYPDRAEASVLVLERGLDRLVVRIVRVCELLTIGLGAWIAVTLVAGVFFRYVLNSSIGWIEEVTPLMLVALMLSVAPIGFHENIHIRVEILLDRSPRIARMVLGVFINAAAMLLFGIAGWYGAKVAGTDFGTELDSVHIARGWFTGYLPVAAVAVWLVCINNILKIFRMGDIPARGGSLE